ncbi:MAG: LysM peptidoglycan-binding domain-containing protein [Gammaproteobacteria bacterium]|nr:LysM peptidoglycan-binding domain-containing protein [Gammaproteobacteria bacterium]
MPTTRFSLATICLSALVVLSGCTATLPKSASNKSSHAGTLTAGSNTGMQEQTWPQAPDLPNTLSAADLSAPIETDIWTRIRQGFQLTAVDNSRIDRQLKWYRAHPEHLPRIEERAQPYLFYIVDELDKRNMPMELALLPVVESAFRPSAYSAYRAAGLWQFIPSTGTMFGLQQNWWYDGRRDVVASTQAALNYLQSLAKQFDGNWELALAAYNSGGGTVRRAIRKNRKRGKTTDYWSLDLPRETRRYVPQLLALAKVVRDPEAYGTRLSKIRNQPVFDSVDIGTQLDLSLAAKMADVSIEELYQLNPGFNRWATAPQGPHRLVLPLKNIERFKQKLAQLEPGQRLNWTRYTIQPGDNLGSIARRHRTTIAALKQTNRLRGNTIRAGKHLLIPGSVTVAANRTTSMPRQRGRKVEYRGNKTSYSVRSGDSLWTIAQRHKVSHKALARWNGIALGDTLRPGQKLVVFSDKNIVSDSSTSAVSSSSLLRYSVVKGDSLARIAQRFKVKVSDLRKWNHLPGKYLQPGQNLNLRENLAEQSL